MSRIRLLTLAIFVVAPAAGPLATPAKAAADSTTTAKKKHKKMHSSAQMRAPANSQTPRNMSDDPDRKAAAGGY